MVNRLLVDIRSCAQLWPRGDRKHEIQNMSSGDGPPPKVEPHTRGLGWSCMLESWRPSAGLGKPWFPLEELEEVNGETRTWISGHCLWWDSLELHWAAFFFPSEGQIGLVTVSEEPDINQLTLNFKCCNLLKSINDRFLEIKLGYFKVWSMRKT